MGCKGGFQCSIAYCCYNTLPQAPVLTTNNVRVLSERQKSGEVRTELKLQVWAGCVRVSLQRFKTPKSCLCFWVMSLFQAVSLWVFCLLLSLKTLCESLLSHDITHSQAEDSGLGHLIGHHLAYHRRSIDCFNHSQNTVAYKNNYSLSCSFLWSRI